MPKGRQLQGNSATDVSAVERDLDKSEDSASPVAEKPEWLSNLEALGQKHPELYESARKFAFRFNKSDEETAALITKYIADALLAAKDVVRAERLHQRYLKRKGQHPTA